jgi:ABC-2 type transport system permease protein
MFAIYKKELRSYFITPVGYVYVGIFLALSALLCCYTTLQSMTYNTSSYFMFMVFALVILIPLLTMRLFADEKKQRTEQMILTAPVSITGMVLGKFLAAYTVFGSVTVFSSLYFLIIGIYGHVKVPLLLGNLLAVLLVGMALIAIGLFISAITENQLSAAVVTIGALALMLVLNVLNSIGSEEAGTRLINNYAVRYVIDWVSVVSRYDYFRAGYLDWSAMLYYCSLVFVFLFLTVRIYERRRWA